MSAGYTEHYGWKRLGPGESIHDEGSKFGTVDRDQQDQLIFLMGAGHTHDGEAAGASFTPSLPPELDLSTTGGSLPAGYRIYYKYTLVEMSTGIESMASPESFVDTPDPIAVPERPGISWSSTGGTLQPGQYAYALTAWVNASTQETVGPGNGGHAALIQVPVGTFTNELTLDLPALPDGADGFNVYRRKPGGRSYLFMESIDMGVATPPDVWVDDGSIEEDCDRIPPAVNTTHSTNSITVTYPGATPVVPDGFTWKIYRTVDTGDYAASFLHHVVEETSEGSGIIDPDYLDIGNSTSAGEPPRTEVTGGSPSKIQLTDGANIQGTLPAGMVAAFPYEKTFAFPGPLDALPGEMLWPIPFDEVEIIGAVCSLGDGSVPVADDVIADVLIGEGATPTFASVYAVEADQPTVDVGDTVGVFAPATVAAASRRSGLADRGCVRVDINQIGGSATPTDEDLSVVVSMWVRVTTNPTTSHTWS